MYLAMGSSWQVRLPVLWHLPAVLEATTLPVGIGVSMLCRRLGAA